MSKQINIRMDAATYEKLEYLLQQYDSKTKVVAVAIDRLYVEYKMKQGLGRTRRGQVAEYTNSDEITQEMDE